MLKRTDLAIESAYNSTHHIYKRKKEQKCKLFSEIFFTKVENEAQKKETGLEIGEYITVSFEDLLKIDGYEEIEEDIIESLEKILPEKRENILVVGLGNEEITSDAIGPLVAKKILATRHIEKDFAEQIGLKGIKSVSVIAPNVLGKTGMETAEIIKGITEKIKPDCIIAIDALLAGSITRLFKTIQICNTGISPGSGVKNRRKEISEKTVGIPVIAIGVPTVVDAVSLSEELSGKEAVFETDLIVTPKDSDLLCHRISEIIATALNVSLQPEIEKDLLLSLV